MAKEKESNNKKSKKIFLYVAYAILMVVLCVTLFFSSRLEVFFRLKPNTSALDSETDFEIHFIDVGQGDSIAMRFSNGKTMLVDAGPIKGESNLRTYLNNVFFKGYDRVFDYVLLTHSDADHCGNMAMILHNYTINKFFRPYIFNESETATEGLKLPTSKIELYTNVVNLLKSNAIATEFFKAGDIIDIGDGIKIDFYAPVDLTVDEVNDFSPIMVVTDNEKLVCLTGDASSNEEAESMANYTLPDVDLLKLGHHGSKYSTSAEFLAQIQPEYVVAQVGKNSYGHPSSDVLTRLANYDEAYGKHTYSGFLNNLDDGNIIYHVEEGNDFAVLLVDRMSSFAFVDWYIVVIIIAGVATVFVFVPKTKKYTKKKKTKSKK